MMKKKNLFIFGCVIVLLILVINFTYSKWAIGSEQNQSNILKVACFDTTLTENSYISLENAYPITDIEGLNSAPFSFTLKNNCSVNQNVQINLEILNTTNSFDPSQIKFSLNGNNPVKLSTLSTTEKSLENATNSYIITNDVINVNNTNSYNLRMWIDENETVESASNKTFEAKITVTTSYGK